MARRPRDRTLGELLAARRTPRFVGRRAELELFRSALDEPGASTFSVLHVHGPGGIGKTSLLDAFADLAAEAGAVPVRLDGRDLTPSPDAVVEALGAGVDVPAGGDPIAGPGRIVLLVDSYEHLVPLDDWLRTRLLPRLPSSALTVLAGRAAPAPAWRADRAWSDLLRVVSLRNWSPQESRSYLDGCGVGPESHERLLAGTHGHPLGLALLADVTLRGGDAAVDPMGPDVVAVLVRRFLDVVPDARHRRVLEICAIARTTTESLLRGVLALEDAHGEFGWLRGLSFVESGPDGLSPHDLARDVLDLDLRWRDPDGYRQVVRSVREHLRARLRTVDGVEQQRAVADEKFLFENLLSRGRADIEAPFDGDSLGRSHPEPARPDDRGPILELVRAWEGDGSAAIAERWLDRQPEGFHVVRAPDGTVGGLIGFVDLGRAAADDIAADPGAEAACEFARRNAPPRPGEAIRQTRFVLDRTAYQAPSPTMNVAPILSIQRHLGTPNLSWNFLVLADPDRWEAYFAVVDSARVAEFGVGDHRYGLFAHDYRQVPVEAWLELVIERALSGPVPSPPVPAAALLVLAREQFDRVVRQALHDLSRPDLLARSPLLRTRLLRDRAGDGEPGAATLRDLIREAAATLGRSPRDAKLQRAFDRTYLRPAGTQERAAEVLGLPFSTYRRHLSAAVGRVLAWLWEREVYGPE